MKRLHTHITILFLAMLWLASATNDRSKTEATRRTDQITFTNQVVRLMQQHCQVCHHQGGIAPFPLTAYEEVYPRASSIKSAVVSRRMPDGASARLDSGCGNENTFEGVRRLTQSEIEMIVQWVDAGAPEGNPADMPPPMSFNDGGWKAGDPDFQFANAPGGFIVPGLLNRDFFRRFPIKTSYESDRYFVSFESLPGTGVIGSQIDIVHHVTLFIDPTCGSLEQEREFAASNPQIPGPGFEGEFTYPTSMVGMWFPGTNPIVLQDGIGIRIPRGACLVMEVHYTTWHPETVVDKTYVGLRWARTPIYKERVTTLVNNVNFVIPAGAKHYEVNATRTFDEEITIYSLAPHMHQFGTDFIAEALLPSGEKRCLIDVEYDFKHQGNYLLRQPIRLPAGTRLNVRAFYDNSEDNPRQFHRPPIDIPFGPTSDKEMCQLTVGLTYDNQALHPSSPDISMIQVSDDSLIITGSDLRPGAFIEINGKLLLDTRIGDRQSYVYSPSDWRDLCSEGKRVKIAVINPDGGRTQTRTFLWRGTEDRGRQLEERGNRFAERDRRFQR
jgi:hypothetical protein